MERVLEFFFMEWMELKNFILSGPSEPPEVPSARKRKVRFPNLRTLEMMGVIANYLFA